MTDVQSRPAFPSPTLTPGHLLRMRIVYKKTPFTDDDDFF